MFDIKNVEIDSQGNIIKAQIIDNGGYTWYFRKQSVSCIWNYQDIIGNGYYAGDIEQALFILKSGGYI